MLTRVFSAAIQGVEGLEVEIEVNTGPGEPKIIVVGLPDVAVKESKDRVTTAIANSGFRWPRERTTINLAPADIKKEGPSFDLPIALGMIAAAERADLPRLERCLVAGELALTGEIRSVKGALPIAIAARDSGKKAVLLPACNAPEAAIVEGISVYGVRNLREAYEFLAKKRELVPTAANAEERLFDQGTDDVDFSEVKGQQHVKRAVEVAVAGGHNILLIGPPGSGKSMLAKRIATIIPPMTLEEAIATTKIHSICGLLDEKNAFVARRPFRSPHHTISDVGLLGGSANPTPGEVSIAHNGVLFLDELPEFKRSTLEVMRQPLEDGCFLFQPQKGQRPLVFPASFLLVGGMAPCPCGYRGDPSRECRCSPGQVEKYRARIPRSLLALFDIQIVVPPANYKELSGTEPAESSSAIRARVVEARRRKSERKASGKTTDPAMQVARTIADLAGSKNIRPEHIEEAMKYRVLGMDQKVAA